MILFYSGGVITQNPHSLRCVILLILLVLVPAGLTAQTQEPSKVIKCSFLYWDGIPEEKFYFRLGEEYHSIKFRQGSRGEMISLKRMSNFEVFREVENPNEGQAPYEILAAVSVPSDISKVLFLVLPPDKEGGEYRVVAMDDSVEEFSRKTFRFFNLTEQMISIEFAGETQQVEVNGFVVMESRVDKKGGFIPCIMRDPEGETIYGTRLFAQPNGREDVFIRPSPIKGRKAPSIKFISQLVAAAPVENKQ